MLSNISFFYHSPVPNTYFSTFPTEVSNPAPSPPEETKKVVKEELDFSDIIIEDITDSELMAVDLDNSVTHDSVTASFTADGDAVTDSGISTTNMASQVVQSQSSSTSTSTVTSSDTARGLEGAATDQFSSSNIDAASSSQETSSDNINQNSQSDENTWISCSVKKFLKPSHYIFSSSTYFIHSISYSFLLSSSFFFFFLLLVPTTIYFFAPYLPAFPIFSFPCCFHFFIFFLSPLSPFLISLLSLVLVINCIFAKFLTLLFHTF